MICLLDNGTAFIGALWRPSPRGGGIYHWTHAQVVMTSVAGTTASGKPMLVMEKK